MPLDLFTQTNMSFVYYISNSLDTLFMLRVYLAQRSNRFLRDTTAQNELIICFVGAHVYVY